MKHKTPRIKVEILRDTGYGSVPGLDDDELASPAELLRQIALEQWGLMFEIPVEPVKSFIRPTIDERGNLDWGAFGTIDFDRLFPFDKKRYVIDQLKKRLREVLLMFDMVRERLSAEARFEVLEYLKAGKDIDNLKDENEFFWARRYLQVKRIREEIRQIRSR